MRTDIQQEIVNLLMTDYSLKKNGDWLQKGLCPACGKKELFTHLGQPWLIKCGRENKCGWQAQTKMLYPNAFAQFNQRFIASPKNPNATADAYLSYARGFDIQKIKGWYRQGKFWHPNGSHGTATVLFDIDRAQDIYMERLIEPVLLDEAGEKKERKANFHGSHRGLCWQPPGMHIQQGDTIWLVEGCMDAIALNLNGQKSVATLSCVNYPEKFFAEQQNKKVTWVWALDHDAAGTRYLKKWVQRGRAEGLNVRAAYIPTQARKKIDWNDCHLQQTLSETHRADYLYEGSLLIAQSALEKALLIWHKKNSNGFCFDFQHRLYWFEIDIEKFNKAADQIREADNLSTEQHIRHQAAEQSGTLVEIANCHPQFLYFQFNKLTDESWYYARIDFPNHQPSIKNTFTGGQVAAAAEFKKRLLSIAPGGLFTGTSKQLDWVIKHHIQAIKVVETIDFIGYSKAHKAYVFNDLAISNGKAYERNDEDFFEIDKLSIKSLNQGFALQIGHATEYCTDWPQHVYQAFGAKGLVATSFWLGSLFAEQIRSLHKSFPFLEVVGEPGAGKTTLIEFLWKLFGKKDEEGWDPSKATAAAISRKFSQVSNLPVVLIEADRQEDINKKGKFDWDELKTAYNGRVSRSRGVKNGGNETYDPPFRGAIVITQNAEVNASEAILQRIVHLNFDKSQHSTDSKQASDALSLMPVEQLSFFLKHALLNEKQVIHLVKTRTPLYEKQLINLPERISMRIALNHAQLMALSDALGELLHLSAAHLHDIYQLISQMAIERQQAIAADHPIVQQFWETYDYLNGDVSNPELNHSRNKEFIAINLNHFVRVAADHKQQVPLLTDLKKYLKTSKSRKFYAIKPVNSAITQAKTVKCWLFVNAT